MHFYSFTISALPLLAYAAPIALRQAGVPNDGEITFRVREADGSITEDNLVLGGEEPQNCFGSSGPLVDMTLPANTECQIFKGGDICGLVPANAITLKTGTTDLSDKGFNFSFQLDCSVNGQPSGSLSNPFPDGPVLSAQLAAQNNVETATATSAAANDGEIEFLLFNDDGTTTTDTLVLGGAEPQNCFGSGSPGSRLAQITIPDNTECKLFEGGDICGIVPADALTISTGINDVFGQNFDNGFQLDCSFNGQPSGSLSDPFP
ncbi:hypothetical protein DL96DRAFT_1816106 [Flagelloscypha sp. PMI_526]|nr:hypothetical protein DL96DRAFT_1816106 [Flagelloscypha sp. PMI_526]